jgi:alginate O-acetyltransferase complex protein AlgI
MIFGSPLFIFLFLPLFFIGYYALPFRFRSYWILAGSYLFYAWWRVDFLFLLLGTTLITYLLGRRVARDLKIRQAWARVSLAAGIAINLGALAYFKYLDFGIASLNAALGLFGGRAIAAWQVVLPVGISFYTFQAISYLIDVYRGDADLASSFLDLALYLALFPKLLAGPILRYRDLAPQIADRTHTFDEWSEGAMRFMIGLSKKVLVADLVARLADAAFALQRPTFADSWLGALAYTAQIYFDFSGYSDMAIGLGLLMGFRFAENFNSPYLARSVGEFWRRWHMSLSSWLRDYLYIPLGGSRRSPLRNYANLLIVMLLGGLWHGAAWTFVAWGAWHGTLLMAERWLRSRRPERAFAPGIPLTLLFVVLGWVLFRSPDFSIALRMFSGMLGLHGLTISDQMGWQISGSSLAALAVSFLLIYGAPLAGRARAFLAAGRQWLADGARLAILPLFLLSVLKLVAESYTPFLYFRF